MTYAVKNILSLAKKKGVSAAEICRILEAKKDKVNNWKIGLSKPTIEEIVTLANYFGVTTDCLLKEEQNTKNERNVISMNRKLNNDDINLLMFLRDRANELGNLDEIDEYFLVGRFPADTELRARLTVLRNDKLINERERNRSKLGNVAHIPNDVESVGFYRISDIGRIAVDEHLRQEPNAVDFVTRDEFTSLQTDIKKILGNLEALSANMNESSTRLADLSAKVEKLEKVE